MSSEICYRAHAWNILRYYVSIHLEGMKETQQISDKPASRPRIESPSPAHTLSLNCYIMHNSLLWFHASAKNNLRWLCLHQSWFNILHKRDSKYTKHAFHSLSHDTTSLSFLLNSNYSIIKMYCKQLFENQKHVHSLEIIHIGNDLLVTEFISFHELCQILLSTSHYM
jgi:hypothetical protein